MGKESARFVFKTNFTAELLQEMTTTQKLVPTGPIDIVGGLMEPLLTIEEGMKFVGEEGLGEEGLECCCFNHRYLDGSFFKMWIKCRDGVGYFLAAPWQEMVDAAVLKPGTVMDAHSYREEADIVIVFS